MKTKKFAKIFILIMATVLCLGVAFSVIISAVNDEASDVAPKISSFNIRYSDKFSLMYAVDADTVKETPVTLTVYPAGGEDDPTLVRTYKSSKTEMIKTASGEKEVYVFITEGVSALNFTTEYYAKASDGTEKVGKTVKYSVAEYLYQRLGTLGISDGQRTLYKGAIRFGKGAQMSVGDNVLLADSDKLISNLCYAVVKGGKFASGYTTGLFPKNKGVSIIPNDAATTDPWAVTTVDEIGNNTVENNVDLTAFTFSEVPVKTLFTLGTKDETTNQSNYPGAEYFDNAKAGTTLPSEYGKKNGNATLNVVTDKTGFGNVVKATSKNRDDGIRFTSDSGLTGSFDSATTSAFEFSFNLKMTQAAKYNDYLRIEVNTSNRTHRLAFHQGFGSDGAIDNLFINDGGEGAAGLSTYCDIDPTEWFRVKVILYNGDTNLYVYINDALAYTDPHYLDAFKDGDISKITSAGLYSYLDTSAAENKGIETVFYIDNVFAGFTNDTKPAPDFTEYRNTLDNFKLSQFCFDYATAAGKVNKFPMCDKDKTETDNAAYVKSQIDYIFYNPEEVFDYTVFKNGNYVYSNEDPSIVPTTAHPRILFTADDVPTIRNNLTDPQNAAAYKKLKALSEAIWDGDLRNGAASENDNYQDSKVAIIEAKAFRYAIEKGHSNPTIAQNAKKYGYEAIIAVKNAILTLVDESGSDTTRSYGYLLYVAACVYDWCYDLLSENDKVQIIAGCVSKLGYKQEAVSQSSSYKDNLVPFYQGTAYGHGAEDQILVDYLAFAIACYGDVNGIYNFVGNRILEEFVPHQNYLGQSGGFWEGAMYGSVRGVATMMSNLLFANATGTAPFDESYVYDAIISATYYVRPDGQFYRIGDVNENSANLQFHWMAYNCFYAGNFYGDNYLKSVAYKYLSTNDYMFNNFANSVAGLSAAQFLAINNPGVGTDYDLTTAPLTYSATYPYTNVFAKSDNTANAFGLYMNMQEMFAPSHGHAEAGSFQIYYKGALATDSGAYAGWGNLHTYSYQMSTVAANSILVYNQNIAQSWKNGDYDIEGSYNYAEHNSSTVAKGNLVYSGGQVLIPSYTPADKDELINHSLLGQTQSLGTKSVVGTDGKLLYTYLGGDMTGAYDPTTVDEVSRYMIAVATGNADHPYAFITFDRITSDDASFHKSSLIHVQQAPTITGAYSALTNNTNKQLTAFNSEATGTNYAVITNGGGQLVVQTVGAATKYTVIGGEGYEFWIPGLDESGNYSLENGQNLPHTHTVKEGSKAEYGWGRIEISPETAEKTNHILTVMYVGDAGTTTYVAAADLSTETLAGTQILGQAVFFPKGETNLITTAQTFTINAADSENAEVLTNCYITGVDDGEWIITKDGVDVTQTVTGANTITVNGGEIVQVKDGDTVLKTNYVGGEHIITFAAGAGTYTLTPVN